MEKHIGVMDTSFWSAAVHAGALPFYFERPILVPTAVIAEVERTGGSSLRITEDRQRFRLWLEDGRLIPADPRSAYPLFGPGEAACIGLALEQGCHLLVNEKRAYEEAQRIGVRAVTVPEVVVRLVRDASVSPNWALRMLEQLEGSTSPTILALARKAIPGGG